MFWHRRSAIGTAALSISPLRIKRVKLQPNISASGSLLLAFLFLQTLSHLPHTVEYKANPLINKYLYVRFYKTVQSFL